MGRYSVDVKANKHIFEAIFTEFLAMQNPNYDKITRVLINNPDVDKNTLSKAKLLTAATKLNIQLPETIRDLLQTRKIRTLSGVAPVTVLTKPFPCPGKCIFCPNDVKMPKSYMSDEPGAQRAYANSFDPYYQTFNRLVALRNMGHNTDKVELIILGGTWSSYPEFYQIWFVKRCFDAMNDFGQSETNQILEPPTDQPMDEALLREIQGETMKETYNQIISVALNAKLAKAKGEVATWEDLFATHKRNETAKIRCIGLVIETRPDEITLDEVVRIRKLGATKVQIGIQSLNNRVLKLNKRGHNARQTRDAINMLRRAGFKIHAHWMPNLYGSTPFVDKIDYLRLFLDKNIRPDELKVYPCSLIASAELMKYYKSGKWHPYSKEQLQGVLEFVFKHTPRYARLTRVIRDIPSTDIVVGNKITNFRQLIKTKSVDIRAREIRGKDVKSENLELKITRYKTGVSQEYFLEQVTYADQITAFLRLSLSKDRAMIREVHVYGQSVDIGKSTPGAAQHVGLGKGLIDTAMKIAIEKGFTELFVISSIGTREYYKKLGFITEDLYQKISLV